MKVVLDAFTKMLFGGRSCIDGRHRTHLRGTVVERRSLTGELSLSYIRSTYS